MFRIFMIVFFLAATAVAQPLVFDTTVVTTSGDLARFHVQIPSGYDAARPPAILVGWHALGGTEVEIFAQLYDEICDERGWIIVSHMGPNDRHWNTRLPQVHCRTMLEWIEARYPFSRDSIYMCGGSMGAAAGQVWHNNNCAYDDYLIAATAGGSMILDTQLRQEQYLASGDTNRSMRVAFGGFPFESDSIAYEYHRYSAVYFADTTESMHFNALTVPVWSNWGDTQAEWDAYGYPAFNLSVLRAGGAESHFFPASWVAHGFGTMITEDVCAWFAQHSVNRFPDTLALAADEDGRYYYCDVVLGDAAYTFARADVRKDAAAKRLDIALLRNVAELTVNFAFPWTDVDTLRCHWQNADPAAGEPVVRLAGLSEDLVAVMNGVPVQAVSADGELSFLVESDTNFTLTFMEVHPPAPVLLPSEIEIESAYPNPFNGQLGLTIASRDSRAIVIQFFDVLGRLAASRPATLAAGRNRLILTLPELGSGAYWTRAGDSAPVRVVLVR